MCGKNDICLEIKPFLISKCPTCEHIKCHRGSFFGSLEGGLRNVRRETGIYCGQSFATTIVALRPELCIIIEFNNNYIKGVKLIKII